MDRYAKDWCELKGILFLNIIANKKSVIQKRVRK